MLSFEGLDFVGGNDFDLFSPVGRISGILRPYARPIHRRLHVVINYKFPNVPPSFY